MTDEQANQTQPNRRRAFVQGLRDAIGVPALILGASYLGFGSLVRASDFGFWPGMISTVTAWAIPGQVITVELVGLHGSLAAIALAVVLINARLLPLTVSIMPYLRSPQTSKASLYGASHFIAVTSWIGGMRKCPELPDVERLPYFVGFSLTLWIASLIGTAVGYFATGVVPDAIALGLIFLNPMYFMLVLIDGARERSKLLAFLFGILLAPALHLVSPDWSLLVAGLLGGTLAWALGRRKQKPGAPPA
ncbi:MAG: AzlC family ABC transporter permease [Magnetovibrionaceae bacterium]